ncbi:MAG: ABC transporter ATP-binding protein [Methanomicrobiales archaeon]|nr:ABC transporter ATP-binding protein [Methanomicrobiales archaeon]
MIQTKDVTKVYQMGKVQVHALRGVTVTIGKGEFVGIMGASGSGKSTLLHMLGLLDRPSSGSIALSGIDIGVLSDRERARFRLKRLGYVFQDYALVPELNVQENVFLASMVRGTKMLDYLSSTAQILALIGLGDRMAHLHNELSGGEQQRVAIARAIVDHPEILFADEPCANLDTASSRTVLDLFKTINMEREQTIVMVSHEEWHKEYFDRVLTLQDGLIIADTG